MGIRPSPQFNLPPLLLHRGIQVINVVVPSKDWVVRSKDWALEGGEESVSGHPAVPAVQPPTASPASGHSSYKCGCAKQRLGCAKQRLGSGGKGGVGECTSGRPRSSTECAKTVLSFRQLPECTMCEKLHVSKARHSSRKIGLERDGKTSTDSGEFFSS